MEFIKRKFKRKFLQSTKQAAGDVNDDQLNDFIVVSQRYQEAPKTENNKESEYIPWELDQYQVCHDFGEYGIRMDGKHRFQRHGAQVFNWDNHDNQYYKDKKLHDTMLSKNKSRHELSLSSFSKTVRSYGQESKTNQKLKLFPQKNSKQDKFERYNVDKSGCLDEYNDNTDLSIDFSRDNRNETSEPKEAESGLFGTHSINEGPQIFVTEPEDEPMHSSASSVSLDSVSSGSSDSVSHGSYNLWESFDEDLSEDLNKNILKSGNSCLSQICSCEDLTCEKVHQYQLENNLRRKLIPILRDFESNESLNSIDFQIKPKKAMEDVGNVLPDRKREYLENGVEVSSGSKSDRQGSNESSLLSSEELVTTTNSSLSKMVERRSDQASHDDQKACHISQNQDQLLYSSSSQHGWADKHEVYQDCLTEEKLNTHLQFQSRNELFCTKNRRTSGDGRNCSKCVEYECLQSHAESGDLITFGTDDFVKSYRTQFQDDSSTQDRSSEASQLQLCKAVEANEGTNTAKRLSIPNEDINMSMHPQYDPQHRAKNTLPTTEDDITVMNDSTLVQVANDEESHAITSPTSDNDLIVKTEAKMSDSSPRGNDEVIVKNSPSDVGISPLDESESEASTKGPGTKCLHIAANLVNNAAAIILLLDHKLCEGTWKITGKKKTPKGMAHPILPEGFSYGEEEGRMEDLTLDVTDKDQPGPENKHLKNVKSHRRSRSFGTSVSKAITDAVNRLEEMSHESRNKQFHKLFKFIPEDEGLIVSFSCALLRDILLQGRLYLSENWVCFHSNIFTFETQVSVGMEDIENITKEKTVFVVPNAIGIHTNSHKYVFGSLLSRHSTYKQIVRIWQRRHLLDETTSQESGSRRESEPEVMDGEEVAMEAGTEADVEEDEDGDEPLVSPENPEGRLQGDVHVHAQHSDFETRRTPFRSSSSTTQQIHPSMVQIVLAQILTLIQAVLAINIYKSLRRFIRRQPFVAFSALLFFVLTTSAVILGYKIITFRSADETLLRDTHTQLSSLGNAFLSHHHQSHEKVNRLQERLVNQLQAMESTKDVWWQMFEIVNGDAVHTADASSNSVDGGS